MSQEIPQTPPSGSGAPQGAPTGGAPRPSGDRPRYGGPRRDGPSDRGGDRGERPRYGGGGGGAGGGRRPRRKVCSFCVDKAKKIDFKEVGRIRRYISERGKIDPRRKSGNCAKHQRMLTTALKRARHMAMLPYTAEHVRALMSPQARAMAGGPPPPKPDRPPYRPYQGGPGGFRPAGTPFPPRPPMTGAPQAGAPAPQAGGPAGQAGPAAAPAAPTPPPPTTPGA
jgi:small subunit ribosomal protein S18